jgi:DNA repair protein RAD5
MGHPELEERPAKKRRFFVEDDLTPSSSTSTQSTGPLLSSEIQGSGTGANTLETTSTNNDAFDVELLASVIGETLSTSVVEQLRQASDGNIERGASIAVVLKCTN